MWYNVFGGMPKVPLPLEYIKEITLSEKKIGGGAAGDFEIKSCGFAHAFCSICMPDHPMFINAQYKRRKKVKECGNCGKCNECLGITEDGLRFCTGCERYLDINNFSFRSDSNTYRKQCRSCTRGYTPINMCVVCNKVFIHDKGARAKACRECKENLLGNKNGRFRYVELALNKYNCLECGIEFKPSIHNKKYCSNKCENIKTIFKERKNKREKRHM